MLRTDGRSGGLLPSPPGIYLKTLFVKIIALKFDELIKGPIQTVL